MDIIRVAQSEDEVGRCFDVMSELRPHLDRAGFVPLVRAMQAEGYRLAFAEAQGRVVAVAGYRIFTNLWHGRHLYVDDLVTASEARSRGHGEALLAWLQAQAQSEGCRFIDLDSGTQRARAHKFYFTQGYGILGFHFGRELGGADRRRDRGRDQGK